MRHKLLTALRYFSIPLVTAGIMLFLFTRPQQHFVNFKALAQTSPDYQFTVVFTNNTPSAKQNNKPTTAGGTACNAWIVAYWTNGASAVSVQIEGAPDVAGAPGSYTPLTAATSPVTSANPATGTNNGIILACCDYYPWIRINPTTFTGTNQTMTVRVYGYKTPTSVAGGGGSSKGGITALTQDVIASGTGSVPATVVGLETVPFCSGFTPTNGQFVQYTTGSSPNPCYTAATGGGGSSGSSGLTVYSGLAGIALSNATIYFPIGGGSIASSTEANVNTFQGSAGTVSGFGVDISTALGTTVVTNNSVVITWRKNGVNMAVTCTITNPATTCSDTTHSFNFLASDALDIQAVFTGTITATPVWVMNAGVSSGSAIPGSFVLLEQHTASNSAALQFTACISSTYDTYQIEFVSVFVSTNNQDIVMQMSTNGGSSYDSTSGHYSWGNWRWSGLSSSGQNGSNSDTSIDITGGFSVVPNSGGSGVTGMLKLYNPLSGSTSTNVQGQITYVGTSTTPGAVTFAEYGIYIPTTAVNAFQFISTSGNLASGTVRCYGLAK